jgi:TRAP-type C4-dicarboxylate transport system substrate-binding protein
MSYCTIMNKNTWNRLPKDVQKVITDVTNEMMPEKVCAAVSAEKELGKKAVRERGREIYVIPPEERARWIATADFCESFWLKIWHITADRGYIFSGNLWVGSQPPPVIDSNIN